MIPRQIHYCWFGPKPFPKIVKRCFESWQQHLADYEFHLWDEDNSPMDMPFVRMTYQARQYAFVADYIRFWALYNYGGVYLDTDMFVIKSMDELLGHECFLGQEMPGDKTVNAAAMGCEKGHSFLKGILDTYHRLDFSPTELERFVLPRLITPVYENYSEKESLTILPYDCFYPFPYKERADLRNFMRYSTGRTYAIHLWNFSWERTWARVLRRLNSVPHTIHGRS